MTDYQILCFVRDEMLSNPHIESEFVWSAFKLAEHNGDCRELFDRWMVSSPEEKILVERVMMDLLLVYGE